MPVKNKIPWKSSSSGPRGPEQEHHTDVPWLLLEKFPMDIFVEFSTKIYKYLEIHSWGHVNAVT